MPFTTVARAETSPPVVNVHFDWSRPTLLVEMVVRLVAVFAKFYPNIGQSCAISGVTAKVASTTPRTSVDTLREWRIVFIFFSPPTRTICQFAHCTAPSGTSSRIPQMLRELGLKSAPEPFPSK